MAQGRQLRHLLGHQGTDVSDGSLTAKALEEERGTRVLLTSDGGFLERKPVRDGGVGFSRVPDLLLEEQLRLVVGHFVLTRQQSRCMKCNGELRRRAARHGDGPGLAGCDPGSREVLPL